MDPMLIEPLWAELVPEFTLRPQQTDALHRIHKAMFVEGAEVVVLEAPTGVGKSIIELAMCRFFQANDSAAFIVTPQKTLQDALGRLPGMKIMKGRGSYTCALVPELSAATAPCLTNNSMREQNPECSDHRCPYFKALSEAKASTILTHNYASLIAQTHIGGHFQSRGLLCLDEGHTAVDWIRGYMTLELTTHDLATITTFDPPTDADEFMGWFRAVMSEIDQIPEGIPERMVSVIMRVLSHRTIYGVPADSLREDHREESYGESPDDRDSYIAWASERLGRPEIGLVPWHVATEPSDHGLKYICTPIKVAPMANVLTGMGGKLLIVTATVLDDDLLLGELGLRGKKHASVIIESAFPPAHRPIVTRYVGSMSYKSAKSTFPKLVDAIRAVMADHRTTAGIIHTVSHRLAHDVYRAVMNSSEARGRNIVQMPQEGGRDGVIAKFLNGGYGPNAVLIGPGLMEGIDAAGDSARWQIMCKVPWPHMKDPVVEYWINDSNPAAKRRGERWYMWKAVQTSVQGFGRVCRSDDDFGTTYLMDEGFTKILRSEFVPGYVSTAVTNGVMK